MGGALPEMGGMGRNGKIPGLGEAQEGFGDDGARLRAINDFYSASARRTPSPASACLCCSSSALLSFSAERKTLANAEALAAAAADASFASTSSMASMRPCTVGDGLEHLRNVSVEDRPAER